MHTYFITKGYGCKYYIYLYFGYLYFGFFSGVFGGGAAEYAYCQTEQNMFKKRHKFKPC